MKKMLKVITFNHVLYLCIITLLALVVPAHAAVTMPKVFTWTANTSNTILTKGQTLRLQNGQYDLKFENDGELSLLKVSLRAVWQAGTSGTDANKLIFDAKGNLILYNITNKIIWSSGTSGNPNATFTFQDNGNLVIKNATGTIIWSSGTATESVTLPASSYVNQNFSGINFSSYIVNTIYPTEDVVVVDVNAVTAGADPTGVMDSSDAINKALYNLWYDGGGTLWLPPGKYRIKKPVKVYQNCLVRGEYHDPDQGGRFSTASDYGTVILADFTNTTTNVFVIDANSGLDGLTIYYPNQNSKSPYPYDFAIKFNDSPGSLPGHCGTIQNVTLLNAYKGITMSYVKMVHGVKIKNVKGTCLKLGAMLHQSGEAGVVQDVSFNNSYWANSAYYFKPPSITNLNNWTRLNGVGFKLGNAQMYKYLRLNVSHYKIGLHFMDPIQEDSTATDSSGFSGTLYQVNVANCDTGFLLDKFAENVGLLCVNSNISGSDYSVKNNVLVNQNKQYNIRIENSVLSGPTSGLKVINPILYPSEPPVNTVKIPFSSIPKVTRTVLYNLGLPPYSINRVRNNKYGSLPTIDVTTVIQTALNQAASDGGGIVFLPNGVYRVEGSLTVPANVELRGSSSKPLSSLGGALYQNGTTLFVFAGHNTTTPDTDTAFISLAGKNSGVSGLNFYYPARAFDERTNVDFKYPYLIRGLSNSIYVRNCLMGNVYNGIDFATGDCIGFYISRVVGGSTRNLLKLGGPTGGGTVYDVLDNIINKPQQQRLGIQGMCANMGAAGQASDHNKIFIKTVGDATSTGVINIFNCFAFSNFLNVDNTHPNVTLINQGSDAPPLSGLPYQTMMTSQKITVSGIWDNYHGSSPFRIVPGSAGSYILRGNH